MLRILLLPGVAHALETAAIDGRTALVASASAPLADRGGDAAAVWCATGNDTYLVFLHGNDGFVTASSEAPDGYRPGWAPRALVTQAVGPAYRLADLGATVLAPEVGCPADPERRALAVTASGRFAEGGDPLGPLIDDARAQLERLGMSTPAPSRRVVAAHSGGGRPLGALLAGDALDGAAGAPGVPTDVWLLDATYGWGTPDQWASLARAWQAHGDAGSRLVVAWIAGTSTEGPALQILAAAERAGVPVARTGWTDPDRDAALASAPVVGLRVPRGTVPHGAFPLELSPVLLATLRPF